MGKNSGNHNGVCRYIQANSGERKTTSVINIRPHHTGPKSSMSSIASDVIRTHVDFRETEERRKEGKKPNALLSELPFDLV